METLHSLNAKVSVFNGVKNATVQGTLTIQEIIDTIRTGGKSLNQILSLRKEYQRIALIEDKKERENQKLIVDEELKKTLPAYTFSGLFSKRNNESYQSPSGFICVDYDDVINIDTIKQVIEDDWVFCSFLSPTGTGLKVLYKITPEDNIEKWKLRAESLHQFLLQKYRKEISDGEFKIDKLTEVSRLCITSYDSSIYVNENSWIYDKISEPKYTNDIDYSKFDRPQNEDKQKYYDFLEPYITEKFSGLSHPGRHDKMIIISAKVKAWTIFHQLDETIIKTWIEREYGQLFDGNERAERISTFRAFWIQSNSVPPHPIQEFNNYTNDNTKSTEINSVSIEDNITDKDLDDAIFDSKKASEIPPEEELKMMEVDIWNKKRGEIQTPILLMKGSMFGVVATASSGKTSVVNSVLAQVLTPENKRKDVKKIHFKITKNVKRCLVFDSELDFYNYPKFYDQLCSRIGLPHNPDNIRMLQESDAVDYFSMSEYSINTDKLDPMAPFKRLIERAYEEGNPYSLVILDDITIFTPDVNDSKEVPKIFLALKRMAKKYGFGIFATIHANSGDHTGKGRGHSGSELERRGETVLHITRNNETELFEITLGVGNKNRNGGLTFAMHDNPLIASWDEVAGCIVGIDTSKTDEIKEQRKNEIPKPPTPEDKVYGFVVIQVKDAFKKNTQIESTTIKDWIRNFCVENKLGHSSDTIDNHIRSIKKRLEADGIAKYQARAGKTALFTKMKSNTDVSHVGVNIIDSKSDIEIEEVKVIPISHSQRMAQIDDESLAEIDKRTFVSDDNNWIDDDNNW